MAEQSTTEHPTAPAGAAPPAGAHATAPAQAGGAAAPAGPTTLPPEHPLHDLRRSPAAHLAGEMAAGGRAGVAELREIPGAPQWGLRAVPGSEAAARLEAALGLALPAACASTGDAESLHLLWLSPDEFLAVDVSRPQEFGEAEALAEVLEPREASEDGPARERAAGQVVDLSGNRTILELTGAEARTVLGKGCHLDLHPRAFGVGDVASTLLGPVPVILHRSAEDTWRIYPRASFAEFTVRWLLDAMRELTAA